jgi:HK97 gp10 family phage protein
MGQAKSKPKRRRLVVILNGLPGLTRALNALPERATKKVLRKAARSGAKVIADQMKKNMPRDTGTAARAVVVRAAKKTRRGRIQMQAQYNTEKVKAASRKPSQLNGFFYPAIVEYGSVKQNRKPVAPNRRAGEEKKAVAEAVVVNEIGAGITREARALKLEVKR